MNTILKSIIASAAILASVTAHADEKGRLFIIGEATPSGWSLDQAQALHSSSEKPSVYSGTLYLKGGESNTFKFMEEHEWGSVEYGLPTDVESTTVSGNFELSSGKLDDGYKQMSVAESGNYYIVIDTENLDADITLSEYQETEIQYCTLFMIGNATPGGWTVSDGTPLYQVADKPYEYEAVVALKATEGGSPASFKIATALRGAGSWDAKYFIFRDAEDAGKISTDATDDRQWSVNEDGNYTVSVNTIANTISIEKFNGGTTGIDSPTSLTDSFKNDGYYDLFGRKINNPANGIFVEVRGTNVRKVVIK